MLKIVFMSDAGKMSEDKLNKSHGEFSQSLLPIFLQMPFAQRNSIACAYIVINEIFWVKANIFAILICCLNNQIKFKL